MVTTPTAPTTPSNTTTDAFGLYLADLVRVPTLDPEETRELAWRYINDGDEEARDALVQGHARLVVHLARRRARGGAALADLVADGNVGLIRAVEGWDPARGTRFSTYAAWWIMQAIRRSPANLRRTVSVPTYIVPLVGRWRRAREQLAHDLGRDPQPNEIARALSITARTLDSVQRAATVLCAMAEAAPDGDGMAVIECTQPAPDATIEQSETCQLVQRALRRLDPRSTRVLTLRFGLDGHARHSRTEIGQRLGVSDERVRIIESKAIQELRRLLRRSMQNGSLS